MGLDEYLIIISIVLSEFYAWKGHRIYIENGLLQEIMELFLFINAAHP
jgi:uncharacterized membrane protein